MTAFIASDDQPAAARVRDILLCEGLDCTASSVSSLNQASERVTQVQPELIVVTLFPDPDRALAAIAHLHAQIAQPILAVGPLGDSRLVLRALRAGASDYVDVSDLEAELRNVLTRRLAEIPGRAQPGQVIAVLAPSGGSGSSTVATNVATVLARQYKKALLVDLKLHAGDLAALLDLKPTHTLGDLCLNASRMDRSVFEQTLVLHSSGVHLLAPPRNLADVSLVTADAVRQAIHLGRALFPYVILDLDHSFAPEQVQALRLADKVVLVLRLEFACLRNTRRTLDYLAQLGISPERVALVANRYGQAKEVPAAKAEEALGLKIAHYLPEDPKSVNRANNNGIPVVLESPWAKISRNLTRLAQSVNGQN